MASSPPPSSHKYHHDSHQNNHHHNPNQPANYMPSVRAASEQKLGLLHFISPADHGWHGDIRKRFTDFLVNEIRKDGKVLHLEDYTLGEKPSDTNLHIPGQYNTQQHNPTPKPGGDAPVPRISDEDVSTLQTLLGEPTAHALTELYERVASSGSTRLEPKKNSVKFAPMEREQRGHVHREIRRIFASRIETETDGEGIIIAVPSNRFTRNPRAHGQRQRSNQPSFKKLGGDYLHFTLYKENKDTMDAINQIARMLKIKSNHFGFAGTKDRRAATVQRMSVQRVKHQTLDFLNRQIPAIKMGDYKYSQHPIQLGDHGGNEFKITVKNVTVTRGQGCSLKRRVQMTKQAVDYAVTEITKYGFINYFGLQRFGTHIVGTHELGKMLLMGDFEAVIDGLLHVDSDFMAQVMSGSVEETPMNRDEINRVRAITQWKAAKNAKAALQTMPKRFSAETTVINHLDKNPRDFQGAILTITRGMRNLYLHAYQSYVWNHVVSHRWAKYGSKVIPGDLVLVASDGTTNGGDDVDDMKAPEESFRQKARPLSQDEVQSGKYSIFDIVLPCPGFDVIYPKNDIGEFYVEFMQSPNNGGLDPHGMRRTTKDFSLSGAYRYIVGRFKGEPKWEVRTYTDENEQMRPTDLDLVDQRKAQEIAKDPVKQTSVAKWSHFSANAVSYDDQIAAERRRQQTNSPEAEPRINDVWVQRSEDGSLKRVKVKHEDTSAAEAMVVDCPGSPESTTVTTPHGGGAPLYSNSDDGIQQSEHVKRSSDAVGASLATDTNNDSQQPAKPTRQPTVPTSGSAGFADSADSQASKQAAVKTDTVLSQTKTALPVGDVSSSNNAVAMAAINKHLQQGAPHGPSALAEGGVDSAPVSRPNSSGSGTASGVYNSAFKKDRSTSPMALDTSKLVRKPNIPSKAAVKSFVQPDLTGVDESKVKIAVILEFGLNQSAYATVVLRELMAEVEPEK